MAKMSWKCPFCNHDATIGEDDIRSGQATLNLKNAEGPRVLKAYFVVCPNEKCKRFTLTASLHPLKYLDGNQFAGDVIQSWSLIPSSKAIPLPDYIPKAVRDDYEEACLISDLSPKASATLSRRCLQGMIRDFWSLSKPRLVEEIAAIKSKVDPDTWDAIEAVRKVGNIGAHMEADINVIVDVEPAEAVLLIGLIETLIKDWYIAREKRRSHLSSLVTLAADKEKAKKAPPIPPTTPTK
jgi:hypothetical protein